MSQSITDIPIISATNLQMQYGTKVVLDGVDLTVEHKKSLPSSARMALGKAP